MRKVIYVLACIVLAGLLVAACAPPVTPTTTPPTATTPPPTTPTSTIAKMELRISHEAMTGSIHGDHAEKFCQLMSKYTGGAIVVRRYEIGALYETSNDMLKATITGALDFTVASGSAVVGAGVKEFGMFSIPGLLGAAAGDEKFSVCRDRIFAFVDDPNGGGKLSEFAEAKGLKMLHASGYESMMFFLSKPFDHLTDLAGRKIRTPTAAPYQVSINSVGAKPIAMAAGDIYVALQQGTIDGAFTSRDNLLSTHLYEVAKYNLSNYHVSGLASFVMISMQTWNKFSPEVQNITLQKVIPELRQYMLKERLPQAEASIDSELAKAGLVRVKLPTEELVALESKYKASWEGFRADYGDLLDAAIVAHDKYK